MDKSKRAGYLIGSRDDGKGAIMAKNRYIIVKHVDQEEVKKGYAETLYYNGYIGPHFIMMRNQAQEFTNKRTARDAMKYANDYASGCEIRGWTEVVKLEPGRAEVVRGLS